MKFHEVENVDFAGSNMILTVDGRDYQLDLTSISERLARASDAARRSYSIAPSGYGIHWPEIDEDLTVDGLIAAATPALSRTEEKI